MPAPLAKGLIVAASVLVAAGIAAYENEQVQAWLERTRRKIASAIYNLGEDVHRASQENEKVAIVVEAAKKKRDEVLATGRELFVNQLEKRSQQQSRKNHTSSSGHANFDDFLKGDTNGAYTLRNTSAEPQVTGTASTPLVPDSIARHQRGVNRDTGDYPVGSTSDSGEPEVDPQAKDSTPRRRTNNDLGSSAGNEVKESSQTHVLFDANEIQSERSHDEDEDKTRESSATLEAEQVAQGNPGPLIQISSEPHSEASSVMVTTPTSTASIASLSEEDNPSSSQPPRSTSTYFSVNEWAEHMSPAFYTTPQNATQLDQPELWSGESSHANSVAGSVELIAENGSVGGESRASDIISDTSGMRTPGTWTEVGSEVSEGDIGGQ